MNTGRPIAIRRSIGKNKGRHTSNDHDRQQQECRHVCVRGRSRIRDALWGPDAEKEAEQ